MSVFSKLGLAPADEVNRIDSGEGKVRERTVELGGDVIALENIGTMRLVDGKKDHSGLKLGAALLVLALIVFSGSAAGAVVLAAIGALFIFASLNNKVEVYLLIGSCDGRTTIIVSKDRQFLVDVRNFLRRKIDTRSAESATINISNSQLSGTIAIGPSASAQGA